jgi:hypothetical protein
VASKHYFKGDDDKISGLFYLVVSLREKLDGGESLDLDIFDFVGGGVHLGDDDVFFVGEVLSKLVPDGNQLLAVT